MSPAEMSSRIDGFCNTFDLRIPVLMAPMAGACPPELVIAVADAGGMGACGALMMQPDDIAGWVSRVRAGTNGAFQINTWVPDPAPERDEAREFAMRTFLASWGPEVPEDAGKQVVPDFDAQCAAMLAAGPHAVSSIMGLFPPDFVAELKHRQIKWLATVTTVAEARAAEAAGADAVIAQGMEAGGHRGAFTSAQAETMMVGLFSLLPAIADAVSVPVVAAGGIADARGAAAAFILGASAIQVGTALLRSPEADINPAWREALARARPEDTVATRAFSGRLGRSLRNAFVEAVSAPDGPALAPYPVQRGLTRVMREEAAKTSDINRMQTWAGQSAGLARAVSACEIVTDLWAGAQGVLLKNVNRKGLTSAG